MRIVLTVEIWPFNWEADLVHNRNNRSFVIRKKIKYKDEEGRILYLKISLDKKVCLLVVTFGLWRHAKEKINFEQVTTK